MTTPTTGFNAADSAKWSDRWIEFRQGALTGSLASTVIACGTLAATVADVFPRGAAAVLCVAAVAGSVSSSVCVFLGMEKGQRLEKQRPVARRLGTALGMLMPIVGGYAAYPTVLSQAPSPPSVAPTATFNATADNCDAVRVKESIQRIRQEGFRVSYTSPAPRP